MSLTKMLEIAVKAADSKRAEDIVALDVQGVSMFTDALLIMDAPSNRQVLAITQEIVDKMHEAGFTLRQHEGRDNGEWVVLDFGDLTVHVFKEEMRNFYGLEQLWAAKSQPINIQEWLIED
ncbi:ribosome silencing factor [Weissella kandleri]|uniref:ribosome silencing factor n=1 Tax=Weissella kandleri TaxID=1616 RepID=UPI00387E765B